MTELQINTSPNNVSLAPRVLSDTLQILHLS